MRRLTLVGLVALGAAGVHCTLPNETNAGGSITVNVTNLRDGSTAKGGTFEAKTVAGFFNSADHPTGSDAGWSIITGTPNVLDSSTCKGVSLGFAGKPAAGRTLQLAAVFGTDGGVDAGAVGQALNDLGTLSYQEGCVAPGGSLQMWRSTSGNLVIDSVDEPAELPAGATPGANKTITFHVTGVELASDGAPAAGLMSLDGSGTVELFTGMNQ